MKRMLIIGNPRKDFKKMYQEIKKEKNDVKQQREEILYFLKFLKEIAVFKFLI